MLLPVATVVLLSFVEEGSWTTQVLPDTFTLANYAALATEADVLAPITSSLWMAALATAANVVFGVATALVIVKGKVPGRGVLRALSLLPFAVPGTVMALGLLVLFDEPTALAGGAVLIGTVWLLPLAYFVRHVPLVVRATQASLESFDDRLAEASADLGAGGWATFRRVVLPAIGPGVVAGGLLTFVTALGEFVASIMLYVYANRPIAVEVFSQLRHLRVRPGRGLQRAADGAGGGRRGREPPPGWPGRRGVGPPASGPRWAGARPRGVEAGGSASFHAVRARNRCVSVFLRAPSPPTLRP